MPSKSLVRQASLWTPPLLYMALIYGLSAQPNPLPEVTTRVWDKLLHAVEYAVLACLFYRALAGEMIDPVRTAILAVFLTSGYAAIDEYHQMFVPMRNSDIRDWMADSLGAGLSGGVCALVRLYVSRIDLNRNGLTDEVH